ncbi:von Willebrand factor A domain-containing protein 7-like [Penaeus japonicus]|uniref:von Willebrand factor A domain-containing protein 7-like n=1 Tax=Penaeus japonicus TaxID=27405 RepID=UPI001C70DFC4|nr:von Willebrand factor A domain-containing protein 7-like [Penaeus japonicus]
MGLREAALLLLLVVSGSHAFLATPLNATDPDVINILCPEQTTGVTRDHKWITREAIRRNLRQFFLDYPPLTEPGFNVPTDASLTELYRAYYGVSSSPVRFIKAVNSIAASNVKADSVRQLRFDPALNVDGERLDDTQETLADRYPQLLTSILQDEAYPAARSLLGLSLHTLQKFYSHSTWIEQGNDGILAGLGFPGFAFNATAGPGEAVCTPCSNAQGPCTGNVVSGGGLTTGYYQYVEEAANGFLVPKPSSEGKCSHGGVLDDSSSVPAEGGINKDTASPCFSPHYHLHEQAVELAVQATDHYLKELLDAVGNVRYRRLFDLYQGSALSIVIDTTQSMGNDIAAVQNQVALIVNASSPELYILAPYNDPRVGPLTKTDDPEVFLEAVNALQAQYGGDAPELFWHGLQLALSSTPDYGNVYCFTDAGAKDGGIMESMIALAQSRSMKVNIVYSGKIPTAGERLVTGIPEYQELADATGGLFIPSNKFDVDFITPILGDSVESSDVDITVLKDLSGVHVIDVPIDDSILDFTIHVAGYIDTAILRDITGTEYNLTDVAALESTPGVEVVALSEALIDIRWLAPRYGTWELQLESTTNYSLSVTANSTLAWLGDFSILDPSPPHPHYRPAEGRPLTNTVYYLEVILVGYLESDVIDVHLVEYVDVSGSLLRTIPYDEGIDDVFYIRSEPLPEQPFYIKLYGTVHSGNLFSRLQSVLISPVKASVEVLATSNDLSASPGHTAQGDFLVTNYGLESDFNITGTDSGKFLQYMEPSTIHLTEGGSGTVTAHFKVKTGTAPGTVSTVMVTAQSLKQTYSVNTAITHFLVVPKTEDDVRPTCTLANEPDCTGFTYNGICSQKNWTVEATLQDVGSGLSNVYARPDGFVSVVTGLDPGTKESVNITYSADCCTSQVDIIGVDSMGNVGKCEIDMGALGGYILDLEAEAVGETWVLLRWEITSSDLDLHKYRLLINNDFSQEFLCRETICHHNVTYLDPCSLQTFELTPYFYVGEDDRAGQPAFTKANTLDTDPEAPSNGVQLNNTLTTITVSWEAVNSKCISQFEVCYRPFGFEATKICERTALATYTLQGIEACAVYEVSVRALSPSGRRSQSLDFFVNSADAEPDAPRNVLVDLVREDSVTITWDDPLLRVQCIDRYVISYGEVTNTVHATALINARGQHYATVYPLLPCTNYTIDVSAVSKTGKIGPGVRREAATLEDPDPEPVTSLLVSDVTTSSLLVSWASLEKCIDHYHVCYYEPSTPYETCQDVGEKELHLQDLNPCTSYTVLVSTVSISGIVSNRTTLSSRTLDVQPGEPQNLRATEVTAHTVQINYDPPTTNPQCANEYDIQQIRLDTYRSATEPEYQHENIFQELEACTNYELRVRAVSSEGQASAWVSTNISTTEDLPSEPRNFEPLEATPNSLTLVWYQPDENGRCVKQYSLEWTASDGSSSGSSMVAPLDFQVEEVVSGLAACSEYHFNVTGITAYGARGASALLSASTAGCA